MTLTESAATTAADTTTHPKAMVMNDDTVINLNTTTTTDKKKDSPLPPASDSASASDDADTKTKDDGPKINYLTLFRYASPFDRMLMLVGTLGAMANGASQPVMTL
jgi:ATP-binding cassette subfamily B (MDR/TAP) protein 1